MTPLIIIIIMASHLWLVKDRGDFLDARGASAMVGIFFFSHFIIAGLHSPPKTAVAVHAMMYSVAGFGFYWASQRWYGDLAGAFLLGAGLIGFLALMGVYPYSYGQGVALNYWHMQTVFYVLALAVLFFGCWSRSLDRV